MAEEKFARHVANGQTSEVEECVIKHLLTEAGVGALVPGAGEESGGGIADEVGVGGVIALVVAALHKGGGDGVPAAGQDAAVGHDEVAWVFVEEGIKEDAGDDAANERVAIISGIDGEVSTDAGSILGIGVIGQPDAGGDAGAGEEDRISGRADGELELLAHVERRCVPDVAGVVVGKNAEDALVELVVELDFGELLFGDGDGGIGSGAGDGQGDFGEFVGLAGFDDDVLEAVGFKARRADGDAVGAGGEIGEAEVAEVVGSGFLGLGRWCAGTLGEDVCAGDKAALNIADNSGDAAACFWCYGCGMLWSWELRPGSFGEWFRK